VRRPQLFTGVAALAILLAALPALALQQEATTACAAPGETLTFETDYIDMSRAGGEPIVTTHPDGTLLWGSHAGTTHFFGPAAPDPDTAAFLENYEGQTYQYFSEDGGATWQFVERLPITGGAALAGLPNSGFSDPEFAIDAAGNVFISEINLANIAVSKSTDGGRSYRLQNLFSFTQSDRQWMAADEEDVLYMTANGFGGGTFPAEPVGNVGHFIAKSTDGGVTFSAAESPNPNGVADIHIDPSDGTLYEISASSDGTISMAAFRDIRSRTNNFGEGMELHEIVRDVGFTPIGRLIDPTFDIDEDGNLYIVYSDNGTRARPAGLYYSYSTDRGRTWAEPVRVDPDERTAIWPWIAVGDPGHVAITYLQTEAVLENNNAELAAPEDPWNVVVAQTATGAGCDESATPGFTYTQASPEPVHFGTICQGGTVCQVRGVDRRLGDYFSIEVDKAGHAYVAAPDTRQGGAVALPRVLRQVGGPSFLRGPETVDTVDTVERIAGATRVETAVGVSETAFERAETALLARDDTFPDALAASALAVELDAPVLLTPTERVDDAVAAELERLGVRDVVLLGGEAALSEQVERDLEELGVAHRRVAGENRFATAAAVAEEVVALGGDVEQAIVALGSRVVGDAWPDAVAAGNLAATGRAPVLLTRPDELPTETADALGGLLGDGDAVFIAGGTAAVGDEPEARLRQAGYDVTRLAGEDRYGTAVAIVEEAVRQGADPDPALLASGAIFADALVAGPAAAHLGGVLLLVHPDDLAASAATRTYLETQADAIETALIVGGPRTVSDEVAEAVRAAISGE
jgi:putative cell wall-binding protein